MLEGPFCQIHAHIFWTVLLGPIAHLAVSPIANPRVVNMIKDQSHTFVEIDHEIFATVILLLPLIQEGLMSVTSESMFMKHCMV